MKQKKGFMATSLIYSFFLVFLMLMVTILVRSVSNRILLSSIKNDIRETLEGDQGFIVNELQGDYTSGDEVNYAGETWRVLENKADSVVLILKKGLSKSAIYSNLSAPSATEDANKNVYFGTCNDTLCQVKACRDIPAFSLDLDNNMPNGIYSRDTCYYDSHNPTQYYKAAWLPTSTQINSQRFAQTIVSDIVQNWFRKHLGLQRALEKNLLKEQTFQDGSFTYPQSDPSGPTKLYVRLPLDTESSKIISADTEIPFHMLRKSNAGDTETTIFSTSRAVSNVLSTSAAYIRPVIEVIKKT